MGVPGAIIHMSQISDLAIMGESMLSGNAHELQCVYSQVKAAHEEQEITESTGLNSGD
jgi:hypothetical protein